MGPLYGRLFGVTGSLARRNAIRNPRRTAATAAPLTLGVGLLSLLAIVGASMSSAIGRQVTEGLRADYEITTPVSQPLSPDVLPEIARVPGVAVSAGFDSQVLRWHSGSGPLSVYGVNPSVISQLIVPKMVSGSMAALDGGQLLIEQASATLEHLRVGSRIDVTYPDETKGQLTIGGIYQTSDIEGPSLLSETVLGRHTAAPYYSGILVKGSNGASAPLRQALKDATGANPLIQVETRQQLRKSYSSLITLILEITYGLLGMAVIIAVLGVVNTLALSIFERRREIGMLRAIGLNRRGVTRMIQLESVMIALLAAVLGVVVGTFLAWATVHVSKNSVSDLTTVWPYGTLAAFLLVAVLVGLIAAFWPARRATRLDILGSIQTD
jgi:putative ABC transport system permease protein